MQAEVSWAIVEHQGEKVVDRGSRRQLSFVAYLDHEYTEHGFAWLRLELLAATGLSPQTADSGCRSCTTSAL